MAKSIDDLAYSFDNDNSDSRIPINPPEQKRKIEHRMTKVLEQSFHDGIDSLIKEVKEETGLGNVPSILLHQRVKPMLESLERINAEALLELDRTTDSDGAVVGIG